jgi:3D (Asp-Asp-Asp) domain-containing protein
MQKLSWKETLWCLFSIIIISLLVTNIFCTFIEHAFLRELPTPIIREIPQKTIASNLYTVTAYSAHKNQTDSTPHQTATMEKPKAGWTCAVSQDLISWLGGRIYIKGIGVRRVNDLMNKRYTRTIDIFMGTKKDAKAFGRKEYVVVFLGQ